MALGTGLGGALLLGGALVRGHRDAAGEFGFLLGGRHQLARPGLMGMESLVGGRAIAARARAAAAADPGATELRPGTADAAAVFAAAARGDAVAGRIVDEVVEHLALAVVDVCAVVDPERVVLDGAVGRALAPWTPRLAELVAASLPSSPGITVSELAPSAALAGGIAEARRLLSPARWGS
jgi:glucokinase